MSNKLAPNISELLGKVIKDDITRFAIIIHSPNKKGEGFLGEICFVSLEDKTTDRIFHFIVKQAFRNESIRSAHPIRDVFLNEIYFYSKIWPRLQQFQDHLDVRIFDKFAKCFATDTEAGSEKLVFENLRYQGFETFNKKGTFDKEHMEYVFKQYGRFHAVSAAFRALHPKEFSELSNILIDQFEKWAKIEAWKDQVKIFHKLAFEGLIPGEDDDVIEKYKTYLDGVGDKFQDSVLYESKYPVIKHGDCWSNNMMFKYDEDGHLVDIRLIDLQLAKDGSPTSDLAYCLYSSGSKEIFSEFNHYLEVYYKSFSDGIKAFGCDPDELYPFKALKEEWRHCCGMGFTMALMLWKMKLTSDSCVVDLTDLAENSEAINLVKYDEEEFKRRSRDIVIHFYENDFL